MTTILAAIDNSAAARPVLAVALALADLYDAEVEAVHAREDGQRTARAAATAAGVSLRSTAAPVIPALLEAARPPEVAAVVLGTRGVGAWSHRAGHVALELAGSLPKPLMVVPPDAPARVALRRILVPLDGRRRTEAALAEVMTLPARHPVEIVVLHVHDRDSVPLFSDQRHHEAEAWTEEFLRRHCPEPQQVAFELRIGIPGEHVLRVAKDTHADVIALGWSQDLDPGHAAVVREVLERSTIPALLIPIDAKIERRSAPAEIRGGHPRTGRYPIGPKALDRAVS
jgi:nucleotide-binding universal stress UspA family protein